MKVKLYENVSALAVAPLARSVSGVATMSFAFTR
jgi:hypothetical protein